MTRRSRDLPALEGWSTIRQAGHTLGLSRQQISKMVGQGRFPGARAVGDGEVVLIPFEEVWAELRRRIEACPTITSVS